ncbi:MAG: RlmE family RNA methyltransferase [Thermoproteota archaeon]|nr:RlmE family RNA methyltransferase [Thermoproteota archaeon]
MKLSEARKDKYRKLAKENSYRSRAVYKLSQLNKSYNILRAGMNIVDIGAAPGGWLQIASHITGPKGKVVGIDIKEIEPIPNVTTIVGDIENKTSIDKIIKALDGRKADLVLSDLAPNISGLWEMDHLKQIELTKKAIEATRMILKENGSAIYKVFQGSETNDFTNYLKGLFANVILAKPDASRSKSSEMYLVCKRFSQKKIKQETVNREE